MDVPMNLWTPESKFLGEISQMLDQIESDKDIKGVIVASGKDSSFVAGADITMLAACETAQQAEELSKDGQQLFARMENMSKTFVAAFLPALGGGLELAIPGVWFWKPSSACLKYSWVCYPAVAVRSGYLHWLASHGHDPHWQTATPQASEKIRHCGWKRAAEYFVDGA